MSSRPLTAFLFAAMLVACSSAGGVTPLQPPTSASTSTAPRAAKGTLALRIRVPRRRRTRLESPRYVSAGTKGMTIAFAGPSTFTQTINLTPSDPRCSGVPLACTIDVVLEAGNYTAAVDTYDEAPVSGAIPVGAHLLSTSHNAAFTIATGIANDVGITLDGVPASISVGGFPSASAGTAFSNKNFVVTVKDADAYLIVGTYSTPITLTDSDTTGATSIATVGNDSPAAGQLLSSGDNQTISYTGRAITPATIRASAGAVSGSGVFAVALPVFVADSSDDSVKAIPPNCASSSCVAVLGGGFGETWGVAVDDSGNVFASDNTYNEVKEILSGCVSAGCVVPLGGGFTSPAGVAVDGSDDVFVADTYNNAVKMIPPGCFTASCVVTLGGGFNKPGGVAIDKSGNVFVADSSNNAIKEMPPGCASAGCVVTIRSGFNDPGGVAVDGFGNVFVADTGNNAVKKIFAGCTRGVCVLALDGQFNGPYGVAIDGSGNLFVGDTNNNVVKEFPAGCVLITCATTVGGGFHYPVGVAVLSANVTGKTRQVTVP